MASPGWAGSHRASIGLPDADTSSDPSLGLTSAYSTPRRSSGRGDFSRKNVKFIKKGSSEDESRHQKKKFSLNDMLANAKKVEKVLAEPLINSVLENHIPSTYTDEIAEGINHKLTSFSRRLDRVFTEELGRSYSAYRQRAWEKAKKDEDKLGIHIPMKLYKGLALCPPEEKVLFDRPKNTYMDFNVKIKIPNAYYREVSMNTIELSEAASGLRTGNVSQNERKVMYQTTVEVDQAVLYVDELDELKYIYTSFWYLTRGMERDWLKYLYSNKEMKAICVDTPKWIPYDGLVRDECQILFVIEGFDVWTTVEELYKWIQWYRTPGKKYGIGECDHTETLLMALLLVDQNRDEKYIKENLTIDYFRNTQIESAKEYGIYVEEEHIDYDSDGLPADWMPTLPQINEEEQEPQVEETQPPEIVSFIDFTEDGTINLELLDNGEEDDFSSGSESEREEGTDHNNLPYDKNIHISNDEFESMMILQGREEEPAPENIHYESDADSDDMPDQELTPLEAIGIDLIDPSRDSTQIPSVRRIGLVWDPGGVPRPISGRVKTLRRMTAVRGSASRQSVRS